jgi:hypothetical protein
MADNPTPPSGQGSGSEQVFGKYLAKIGIEWDPQTSQQVKKNMDPIQKYILDFNKTTDFKNTFFGKLPGIKKALQSLLPDNVRFLQNMMAIGNASKAGADGMKFYNNNLGFFGKGLTNLTSVFFETGEGATAMGRLVAAGASMATFGISALIALGIALLQLVKNVITAAIDWQNELNDFNKVMGGVTRERLMQFNEGLNQTIKNLGEYGFALGEITTTVKAYMVSGLNPAIAMNRSLIETTMKLHEVTGESNTELASFFSGIMRGSKLGGDSLKALGGSFVAFNRSVEASGVLGNISFGDVKEAINSVGTALLIASNKSKTATNHMMNDLVSLTGLAKALNISVSDLNGKFEEAGNLISSQESGFRAILAISGGANIQNMLGNQFNKTEAMLKVADKLGQLNSQFGGNLNILGQVAEQTFGLSKDVAIKLATMSQEQRIALVQAKEDAAKLQSDGLQKSYESVTNTLSITFDRFKNVLINAFHRALAGNTGLQNIINRISSMISGWVSSIGNPNSPFAKIVDNIGGFVTRLASEIEKWLPSIDKMFEAAHDWLDELLDTFVSEGFWGGIGKLIYQILVSPVRLLGRVLAITMREEMFGYITDEQEAVIGPIKAAEQKDEKARQGFNNETTKKLTELTDRLTKIKREQARFDGLKDTDITVGKNGQFTLVGLERLELASKEDEIIDSQDQLKKSMDSLKQSIDANTESKTQSVASGSQGSQRQRHLVAPSLGTLAKRGMQSSFDPVSAGIGLFNDIYR